MRVGLAATLVDGPESGAGRRWLALAEALAALGVEVVLFLPERARMRPRNVEVAVLPIPSSPTAVRVAAERIHLPRAIRKAGIHLLDTDHYPIPPVPKGTRLVATVHDLRALADVPGIPLHRRLLARRIYRSSVLRADAVVAVSAFTASEIERRLGIPRDRVAVVPNAADHLMPPAFPPPEADFLLHVGHVEPRKNLGVLVEALSLLGRRGSRPRLLLVGREGGKGTCLRLRRLAERIGVGDRLEFAGARTDAELPTLYASCLAAVFPSLYEGFGIPLLEAMRCGAPVLASAAGAHADVAGDAALLFDPSDPEELAARIASVAADPGLRARLREAGRRRAAKFSWRDSAQRLAEVYRSLAG
ncbi:MAG TPA: glycosyltransferase family 1 protein [Planctomycetota bacterium]|nr:glycosyltransferase family 1 protein [Planctomycetota bacterium]